MEYEVIQCNYDELPEEVKNEWHLPNNGNGKESAVYIIQKYKGRIIDVDSDAMEPEDASFHGDLKWVRKALMTAYMHGILDGKEYVLSTNLCRSMFQKNA